LSLPRIPAVSDIVQRHLYADAYSVETVHRLQARKEVILSAGSIGTPHILFHSGIGDKKQLASLGIKPLHHLPSVGQNLSDHALTLLPWSVNSNDTTDDAARNTTLLDEQIAEYKSTGGGPLAQNPSGDSGFWRIPSNDSIFELYDDPAAGKDTPHIEFEALVRCLPVGMYINVHVPFAEWVSRWYFRAFWFAGARHWTLSDHACCRANSTFT
jgi:hypothetical protein